MKYKLLNISKSSDINNKINSICNELEIIPIHATDFRDGLENLLETSVDIITLSISTHSSEKDLLSFLGMLSSDIENDDTPIVIISDLADNEILSSKVSDYNVVAIYSHINWHNQLKQLCRYHMLQSTKISTLTDELYQSNNTNIIDPLTGALNRYGAEDNYINLSSRYMAYGEKFSLIMLDIDHFKMVNDTYGHDIGDGVIISLSNTIKESIRSTDKFIRFGGEEFLIMLPNSDLNTATEVAEKIRLNIQNSLHSSKKLAITSSFGVVVHKEEDSFDSLIKQADLLLYEAKESGRNIVKNGLDEKIILSSSETLSNAKSSRDNLIRSNLILNQYYDAVNDSSIVSKTDIDGVITFINSKFVNISGYSEKELVGQPHSILRNPVMNSETFKELWSTIKSKKMWHGIITNKRKDGSDYIVDTYIYPIVNDKNIIVEYISIRHVLRE